ncbi:hypothetical protein MNB_SV-5-293 [hydrothermal vent metagenome]|uniref:Prepilin-type N-terminal cleavage/methylation domain-containing protein n=1 Tax=hydrothermal vent metagenome TaxID=652676 RepID=A0A1W1EBG0_9ZZZZ
MHKRPGFTIIEVLIAIALMGIILPALYDTVALLRDSNTHLFKNLEKAKQTNKAIDTLYLDLASSDGNISIKKDDFSRVCIENSKNSLYGLSLAKVCWVVSKKEHNLFRIEGYSYDLPLKDKQNVEVDLVMKNIELFDVYYNKDKVLVLLQQESKEPITFMIHGVSRAKKKKDVKSKINNSTRPPAITTQ